MLKKINTWYSHVSVRESRKERHGDDDVLFCAALWLDERTQALTFRFISGRTEATVG